MHVKTKSRIYQLMVIGSLVSCGILILIYNLNTNLIFFYYPKEITQISINSKIRVGGYVKVNSVQSFAKVNKFVLYDDQAEIIVSYQGSLPLLFREGQGIIVEGVLNENNILISNKILIKHDERYMPKELLPLNIDTKN